MPAAPLAEYSFTYDGVTRDVVRVGDGGPAVIVLHELFGVSETCLELADFLSTDFQVHLPVLFGSPGRSSPVAAIGRALCVRRELTLLSADRSSPIAGWLRALARHAAAGAAFRVGVIGMCLTGGLVFPVVLDPSVGAAVAAQPSLPWRPGSTTVTADELGDTAAAMAQAAATGTPVLGLRFAGDSTCPGSRFDRLQAVYREQAGTFLRNPPGGDYPGTRHSTLTDHVDQTPGARDTVRAFLLDHLEAG